VLLLFALAFAFFAAGFAVAERAPFFDDFSVSFTFPP
jgi:hypothetical protein